MQFRAMMRWRNAGKLVSWIEAAMSSGFRFIGDFARNLKSRVLPWDSPAAA
jgi:hypothetical protein